MKFTEEINSESFFINAHSDDSISVNGEVFRDSLIILPDEIIPNWEVNDFAQLELSKLEVINTDSVDVILLSTGKTHRMADMRIMSHYLEQGTGFEVMSTAAACRTYNLLMSEGRRVAGCFIIESS